MRARLEARHRDNPSIDLGNELPTLSDLDTDETRLDTLLGRLQQLRNDAFGEAQKILTVSFDPNDAKSQHKLSDEVGPAIGALDEEQLASIRRLNDLAKMSESNITEAERVLGELVLEINDLDELSRQEDQAARLRLYARIGSWMRDLPVQEQNTGICPVCETILVGKSDRKTGRAIDEHLKESLACDKQYLEQTIRQWEENAQSRLRDTLPDVLAKEIATDLPATPVELIRTGITVEIFNRIQFRGVLTPLKSTTAELCTSRLGILPEYAEPEYVTLPANVSDSPNGVRDTFRRLQRAIAFARWGREHSTAIRGTIDCIIGRPISADVENSQPPASGSLLDNLLSLRNIVERSKPLSECIADVETLEKTWKERKDLFNKKKHYLRAADAVKELTGLGDLIQSAITHLILTLRERTHFWKNLLYVAGTSAPEFFQTNVGDKGEIDIDVEFEGARASGAHICNASDMRATLYAFLFAFRERLLEKHGGLAFLLLDELQEMFDPHNRRHVANALASLIEHGTAIIATTNAPEFARTIKRNAGGDRIDHRQIHPKKQARSCLELGVFSEQIDRKRREFERRENEGEDEPAREYFGAARIYLENRLLDLTDGTEIHASREPMLSDMIDTIRRKRREGSEPYTARVFGDLVDDVALASGHHFLQLINDCHHGRPHLVVYGAVRKIADDCDRVRKKVDEACEYYEKWMLRTPTADDNEQPAAPVAISAPCYGVPVVADLAAFTDQTPVPVESEQYEYFPFAGLTHHAIYYIKTQNFGFSGTECFRALVDIAEGPQPTDDALVVALHEERVYARRLARQENRPDVVALTSEAIDPRRRPPSLLLPASQVRLLRVVGLFFDNRPRFPRPKDEAVLDTTESPIIAGTKMVFRVSGDSAAPLALDGQWLMGGELLLPNQLGNNIGKMVALDTSDGPFVKRIGQALPGMPNVRLFESIRGLGDSLVFVTEQTDDNPTEIPVLRSARLILGVLYEYPG